MPKKSKPVANAPHNPMSLTPSEAAELLDKVLKMYNHERNSAKAAQVERDIKAVYHELYPGDDPITVKGCHTCGLGKYVGHIRNALKPIINYTEDAATIEPAADAQTDTQSA